MKLEEIKEMFNLIRAEKELELTILRFALIKISDSPVKEEEILKETGYSDLGAAADAIQKILDTVKAEINKRLN